MVPKVRSSKYACEHPKWLLQAVSKTGAHYRKLVLECRVEDKNGRFVYKDKLRWKSVPLDNVVCVLPVRCGHCDGCRKLQNDQWAARLIHTAQDRQRVGFLTLSLNDETIRSIEHFKALKGIQKGDNRPYYKELVRPFIKRLRKRGYSFDFFCVSERGEKGGRFHFHLIFFFDNVGERCNKNTGELLDDTRYRQALDLEKDIVKAYGHLRHTVRLPKNRIDPITGTNLRFQTDNEIAFQLICESEWSSNRTYGHNENVANLSPITKFTALGKRYTTAKDAFGICTYFESDSLGMLKYVTNYTQKCQHDGVDTYHRQTGGLGKTYAICHASELYDRNLPFVPCGHSLDGSGYVFTIPTPRYYKRFVPNPQLDAKNFWEYYDSLETSGQLAIRLKNEVYEVSDFHDFDKLNYDEVVDDFNYYTDVDYDTAILYEKNKERFDRHDDAFRYADATQELLARISEFEFPKVGELEFDY